jgi:CelD/BcsL family acetyltransferase involved in cellulose biosynthesis
LKIHIARTVEEIDRLRPEWEFLYENSAGGTLFQSFEWNRIAAAHFASREAPYVVLAESGSSMALLPAGRTATTIVLLGEALFDYRDGLRLGGSEAWGAAWRQLSQLGLPVVVSGLRGENVRSEWEASRPQSFAPAPQVLQSEIGADEFSAAHSRLGRTLRRLKKGGATLRLYDGTASDVIAWIYRQKAAQMQDRANNVFADMARIDFMVAACAMNPARCEVFVFEAGTHIVAALVTFIDRQVRRFYTIWFDSAWAQLSPGTTLVYEVTRRSLAAGLDCDYMTGEQPHKTRFATSAVPLFRVNAPAATVARITSDGITYAA